MVREACGQTDKVALRSALPPSLYCAGQALSYGVLRRVIIGKKGRTWICVTTCVGRLPGRSKLAVSGMSLPDYWREGLYRKESPLESPPSLRVARIPPEAKKSVNAVTTRQHLPVRTSRAEAARAKVRKRRHYVLLKL